MARIIGTAGDDVISPGFVNFPAGGLAPGEGGDQLEGREGSDFLVAAGGNDRLSGGAGNDTLRGGGGADTLRGGDGNDRIEEFEAGDNAGGGAGADTLIALGTAALVSDIEDLLLHAAAVNAGGTGNSLANRITGNGTDNLLAGRGGNDLLAGHDGADTLLGETGADTLNGGSGEDRLEGGAGNDLLLNPLGAGIMLGGNGADTLEGVGSMNGGVGDDLYILTGWADAAEDPATGGGQDVVRSRFGGDVQLGAGIETLILEVGSSWNPQSAYGNDLGNWIAGHDQRVRLYGGGGWDTLFGGAGTDTLDGQAGGDVMVGGAGDDLYYMDTAADSTWENAGGGRDVVVAWGTEFMWMFPHVEELWLSASNAGAMGSAGNDVIWGAANTQWIYGGEGNDTLLGNGGADVLHGGPGRDQFVVRRQETATILDFTPGEDLIWLVDTIHRGFGAVRVALNAATYADGAAVINGQGIWALNNWVNLWLPGVDRNALTANDFAFA